MTTAASDDLILFQRRNALQSADFPADNLDDEVILESPAWVIHGDQVIGFPGWQTPKDLQTYLRIMRTSRIDPRYLIYRGDPDVRSSFDLFLATDSGKPHVWIGGRQEGWGRFKDGDIVTALAFDRRDSWVVMPKAIVGNIELSINQDGPHAELSLCSSGPFHLTIMKASRP